MFTLTLALGLNGRSKEAQLLVDKIRNMTAPDDYNKMRRVWHNERLNHQQLSAVVWAD
jgi:hypothetical protein